jgi:glycosyltransferase involved in cell wall biosynthesis
MKASVVIAVRDDPDGLSETLAALERQTIASSLFEIVVVDDGSKLAVNASGAQLIRLPVSLGSYAARNRALARARGDVLAITDAGCVPWPDWLERGIARLGDRDAVLAGRIAMPVHRQSSLAALVDVVMHLDQERYVREEGTAVTANLMTTRAVYQRVGPFDERLRSSGDFDWTRRAAAAGFTLEYAHEVTVTHAPRELPSELIRKSLRVGEGASARRATQVSGTRPRRAYLDPWALVPRHRETGRLRLRENGADISAFRWYAVAGAELLYVQIPQACGALRADVRRVARRLRLRPLR